jgi:hypothetical protein
MFYVEESDAIFINYKVFTIWVGGGGGGECSFWQFVRNPAILEFLWKDINTTFMTSISGPDTKALW